MDGERATSEEFLQNLSAAAAALQRVLPQVISFAVGKSADEL